MSNMKLYFIAAGVNVTVDDNGKKLPKQQAQLYNTLQQLGEPTQGKIVVREAIDLLGLETRQEPEVLAAWYFSEKRRPSYVTIGKPAVKPAEIEDMTDEDNVPASAA